MNDRSPHLTVRVKLVDLDAGRAPSTSKPQTTATQVPAMAPVPAPFGAASERASRRRAVSVETVKANDTITGEICLRSGETIPFREFENHIEKCRVCSNRVELQLDFIETLETSMYQRQAEPNSPRMSGALLISAPRLNFAICGEMDV